jgi:hypothetical protein
MIGPFKPAPGNFKFVFMLIHKFFKWIEYMTLVKASSKKTVEFLDQVIHRFGISNSIIIDLETQFLRANGQVERADEMILDALKKRMYRENDKAPGRWIKELPSMV